jgi:hypothetical protein
LWHLTSVQLFRRGQVARAIDDLMSTVGFDREDGDHNHDSHHDGRAFMNHPDADANKVQLRSILTCPACGHAVELSMPTDACLFFHECESCHVRLRPLPGDCCVFCSYGSVKCPPVQEAGCCCGGAGD